MDEFKPVRIGGGWEKTKDKKTGRDYYFNKEKGITQWTYPEELGAQPDGAGSWVARVDPKSGKTFYYNSKTRQTQWNKPDEFVDVGIQESAKDAWKSRTDPKSGREYWYNTVTRETSWTKPSGDSGASSSGGERGRTASTRLASTRGLRANSKSKDGNNDDDDDDETSTYLPPAPVNATSARQSVRLGSNSEDVDKFAKLRAMAAAKGAIVEEDDDDDVQEQKGDGDDDMLDLDKLTSELNIGVGNYSMEEYVRQHFNLKRKGMFGKQTTVAKILNWKDELIKKPLHSMSDRSLEQEAVQAFKNIVSFMGDRSSSKDDVGHAIKLLANTVHAPEELRDEVFCQLVKQTRNNPSAENTIRGWQLFAICAGTYPPSKALERYLYSYCDENTKSTLNDGTIVHPGVKPFAQYTMLRLKKSMALGPRREVPTAMEVQAAKERQPVVIRVHLLDGSFKTIPAESWTTMRDLNAMMAKKLKIQDPTPFATYEVSSNDEERVLEEEDRVLDLLSYWQREFGQTKKGKPQPTFQFIFKMRLFFDIPDSDEAAVDLAYIQAVHDVTDSRYPCNQEDCVTLAALQAQERFGDYMGTSPFGEGNELSQFLPAKYLRGERGDELEDQILKIYEKLKGYSSIEAKLNYLDYVKSWKIYGSAYFFVEPQNSRDFPSDVVLAINAKGILVVDPETKDFLSEYPYSEVVTWGHSSQTFVLVVGNLIRQTKIYFKTDQGHDMNALVHAYVNKLLDRET